MNTENETIIVAEVYQGEYLVNYICLHDLELLDKWWGDIKREDQILEVTEMLTTEADLYVDELDQRFYQDLVKLGAESFDEDLEG